MVDDKPGTGNIHFVQMSFEGAFSVTFSNQGDDGAVLDGMLVYLLII